MLLVVSGEAHVRFAVLTVEASVRSSHSWNYKIAFLDSCRIARRLFDGGQTFVSEYEIIGTEGRFAIAALNYLQVSSTDTDPVGSKESLSNGGDRSRGINEADTANFARSYGDCFQRTILSKSARFGTRLRYDSFQFFSSRRCC